LAGRHYRLKINLQAGGNFITCLQKGDATMIKDMILDALESKRDKDQQELIKLRWEKLRLEKLLKQLKEDAAQQAGEQSSVS